VVFSAKKYRLLANFAGKQRAFPMDESTVPPPSGPTPDPVPPAAPDPLPAGAPRFSFDRSDIVSVFAVIISLVALGVSVYEAKILGDQKSIMFEQQKAAVWPYLRDEESFVYDAGFTYVYGLENKGVGPAIVEKAELRLNGELIADYNQLYQIIAAALPDSLTFSLSFGFPRGFILSPGDTFEVLRLEYPRFDRDLSVSDRLSFQLHLCYRSIYGDEWTIGLGEDWPTAGCSLE
jgi:hypothetical protein